MTPTNPRERLERTTNTQLALTLVEAWKEGLAGHALNSRYYDSASAIYIERALDRILAARDADIRRVVGEDERTDIDILEIEVLRSSRNDP
jgi:hypothetical protein